MTKLDEIIAAAAKVFRSKGYRAASVQDIADEVGMLKGSLYHHFASKEDLLDLVVKEPITRLYARVGEIVADEIPASEKLRRAVLAHLEAFDAHYPHLFVYLRETTELERRFRAKMQLSPKQYKRFWQQIVREGMKSGEFRSDLDVPVVAYGLLGMLNWLHKWYDPRGRLGVAEVAAQFSALALSGLAPPAPRRAARSRRP